MRIVRLASWWPWYVHEIKFLLGERYGVDAMLWPLGHYVANAEHVRLPAVVLARD